MSRFCPLFLIAAGIAGCVCSAIHLQGLAFACCSLVIAIGVQELRSTNAFNDQ